ncbi:hypothetical protein FOZ62_015237, partial [Perkinsus olseni]
LTSHVGYASEGLKLGWLVSLGGELGMCLCHSTYLFSSVFLGFYRIMGPKKQSANAKIEKILSGRVLYEQEIGEGEGVRKALMAGYYVGTSSDSGDFLLSKALPDSRGAEDEQHFEKSPSMVFFLHPTLAKKFKSGADIKQDLQDIFASRHELGYPTDADPPPLPNPDDYRKYETFTLGNYVSLTKEQKMMSSEDLSKG